MATITLDIPEPTLTHATYASHVLKRPVEDILADLVIAILPSLSEAPPELQAELLKMTWLETKDLWRIAKSAMTDEDLTRMSQLGLKSDEVGLVDGEEQELEKLRKEYSHTIIRKSRAYAILSVRGGKPLLANS